MNSIFLVLPILTLLMFDLGLTLQPKDFLLIAKRPKAVFVGLFGQLVILPLIAYGLATAFSLPPEFFIGMVLIACCPGGSSSNIFSMLAKGDVALSVSLTALSSVITLITVPFIMLQTTTAVGEAIGVELPVGKLLGQNLVTMLVPIIIGIAVRHFWQNAAQKIEKVLSKCAFPALMLLAGIFFVQNKESIAANITTLGLCVTSLILLAILVAYGTSTLCRLNRKEKRTIIIEVGMQNAAQAIAVASSPFIFNNGVIAVPAIIYALMMNIILLTYVGVLKKVQKD